MSDNTGKIPDQLAVELTDLLASRPDNGRRYLLGITGIPGSGKSTFASQLTEAVNRLAGCLVAAMVPMDGFHYSNAFLKAQGLATRKGSPSTFDVAAFVERLRQLRQVPPAAICAPLYSRVAHEPVADAVAIGPEIKLIVVEGNYLLLQLPPWDEVQPLLDAVWFIDIPIDLAMARTYRRHLTGGRSEKEAGEKIVANDRPNAELVLVTRDRADRILCL
jgi:pantothenate kinase